MDRKAVQEIIDYLDFIVTVQNSEFEIVMQNRKSRELLGEVVGKKCYQVFHNLDHSPTFCRILAAIRGDTDWEEFYEHSLKLWLRAKAYPIEIDGERFYLHFVLNISDVKAREQELLKLNELLKLATKIMRHDVINALTAAMLNLELAKEGNLHHVEKAERAIEMAVKILKHTKELSIAEVELKPYSVMEVVTSVAQNYRVELEVLGDCIVMADDGIFSVFDNLIRNAVDHGRASKVRVSVEKVKDECLVRVSDNGVGIDDSIRDRIFEEGFTTSPNHSGMGLFIVKLLMERYGGSISLENSEEGATFVLRLKSAI